MDYIREFLKELATPLSFPICMLLNKCFEHGKLPIDWKNSIITCIYKKGDKSDPGNYRPISLTCILSKIAESYIKDYIYAYLEATNFLCEEQHGFRAQPNCCFYLIFYQSGLIVDCVPILCI